LLCLLHGYPRTDEEKEHLAKGGAFPPYTLTPEDEAHLAEGAGAWGRLIRKLVNGTLWATYDDGGIERPISDAAFWSIAEPADLLFSSDPRASSLQLPDGTVFYGVRFYTAEEGRSQAGEPRKQPAKRSAFKRDINKQIKAALRAKFKETGQRPNADEVARELSLPRQRVRDLNTEEYGPGTKGPRQKTSL
jgi:hypothetical protein